MEKWQSVNAWQRVDEGELTYLDLVVIDLRF